LLRPLERYESLLQRLERDDPCLREPFACEERELPMMSADVDNGRVLVLKDDRLVFDRRRNAGAQSSTIARVAEQSRQFAKSAQLALVSSSYQPTLL
jgi:hypothetical protein